MQVKFIATWSRTSREDILMQYKSGRLPVLVATDILSRGIDIDNIDLVINFDVPHDGEGLCTPYWSYSPC
jgi:superfamily II DNA/RNA helicase